VGSNKGTFDVTRELSGSFGGRPVETTFEGGGGVFGVSEELICGKPLDARR
jgi:hypothetical protein